ncbi:hypothetical protein HB816_13685 [Listeria booriae]|uniref:hypothetical protein n=1 Tax=Listeria booriae TaxID=1552123 RepID=UPI00162ADE36|nr:hypothetical protein [Listeria booriae]MBC1231501.1 hypothetical protein [Listeria booriae]
MGVWSRLTSFIQEKFSFLSSKGDSYDLTPKYLPMLPTNQRQWNEEAFLSLSWARGHVPKLHDKLMTAGTGNEIVTVGAEYIAGKPLTIKVVGLETEKDDGEDEKLTKILNEALRIAKFDQVNVKAIELAGGGGVSALKIDIVNGKPHIRAIGINQFWVDFRDGLPYRFNFFQEIEMEYKSDVYYLVESREVLTTNVDGESKTGGYVTYSVQKISGGKVTPLASNKLPDEVNRFVANLNIQLNIPVALGIEGFGAYLIQNTPSNSRYPNLELGESDLSQCHDLLLGIDYTFTMYMRELEKTKTKVAASERLFRRKKNVVKGKDEWSFNPDEDYYMLFKGTLDAGATVKDMMQFLQGEFRDANYRETMEYFAQKAVSKAGYNPSTFNLGNREVKATEIWSLQDATVRKIEKKKRLIQNPYEQMLWDFLYLLMKLREGATLLSSDTRVIVEFPDPMAVNLNELSSTLNNMNSAVAMSVEEKVKLVHPKWEDDEVQKEVARIYLENMIGEVPDPEAIGGKETRGG